MKCCKVNEEIDSYKKHYLPLARIKKVMKTDEDVKVLLKCENWFSLGTNEGEGGILADEQLEAWFVWVIYCLAVWEGSNGLDDMYVRDRLEFALTDRWSQTTRQS